MTSKIELYIYDLIMFRDKETKSISLETIHTMKNIKGIHICETNNFRFNESNLNVFQKGYDYLADWYMFYSEKLEIIGIWRFNKIAKNFEVVYYDDK